MPSSLFTRANARRVVHTAFWTCTALVLEVGPSLAAFPIPGLDRTVTDIQDTGVHQGGMIGLTLGILSAAAQFGLSHHASGIAQFTRAAGGGALAGATPQLATYLLQ